MIPGPSELAPAIIHFWFVEVGKERWFAKDAALDLEIKRRFADAREAVLVAQAEGWRDSPEHLLGAILLLDQCSRNIHRGSARAFEADQLALDLAQLSLARGWTHAAPEDRQQFLLMPLMHSEDPENQKRSVAEFRRLGQQEALGFAIMHHDQIDRFGRFPGRNKALGRVSTKHERDVIERGETF